MKSQPQVTWVAVVLVVAACRLEVQADRSAESIPVQIQATAAVRTHASTPHTVSGNGVSIQATVDYGAQLLLVDREGRQTGYDPATGRSLANIPATVYTEDSISDITDSSDDVAEAEARLLSIQPTSPGEAYLLHVVPTDRNTYRVEFRCHGRAPASVRIAGENIGIAPGEQHVFSLTADDKCSDRFVVGVFPDRSGENVPLLTYAFPTSANIHLSKTKFLRIVIIYDRDILPSSFVATLNGEVVTHLFHAKPVSIESVVLPVSAGQTHLRRLRHQEGTYRPGGEIVVLLKGLQHVNDKLVVVFRRELTNRSAHEERFEISHHLFAFIRVLRAGQALKDLKEKRVDCLRIQLFEPVEKELFAGARRRLFERAIYVTVSPEDCHQFSSHSGRRCFGKILKIREELCRNDLVCQHECKEVE